MPAPANDDGTDDIAFVEGVAAAIAVVQGAADQLRHPLMRAVLSAQASDHLAGLIEALIPLIRQVRRP